jgi:putative sterol carrier protein
VADPISKQEIAEIEKRGGKVSLMAKIVSIPGLEKLVRHFHEMKHEQTKTYAAVHAAKIAKLDQLIEAVKGSKGDMMPVMVELIKIQKEHVTLIADFNAHKEHCDQEDDDEPCAYRVTGKRDRRGFIDLEVGLLFTPVPKEENDE